MRVRLFAPFEPRSPGSRWCFRCPEKKPRFHHPHAPEPNLRLRSVHRGVAGGIENRAVAACRLTGRLCGEAPLPLWLETRLWIPAAASVRTSDDLQEVTVWILEIEASAPVVTIDLTLRRLRRVRPIAQTSIANAFEYFLKIRLADQEGIVLRGDVPVGVHEIDVGIVVGCNDVKRPPPRRARQAQQLGEKAADARLSRA